MHIRILKRFCHCIDTFNEWVGNIFCWLVIPLTALVVTEVTLRYIFNRPTLWIWDVNIQILGVIIILGGAYTARYDAHIGVDVIVERLSSRKRAIIDLITYSLFIFVSAVILWELASAVWVSVQTRERLNSILMPPIYPFKVIVLFGFLLLFLQIIAKAIRTLIELISHD